MPVRSGTPERVAHKCNDDKRQQMQEVQGMNEIGPNTQIISIYNVNGSGASIRPLEIDRSCVDIIGKETYGLCVEPFERGGLVSVLCDVSGSRNKEVVLRRMAEAFKSPKDVKDWDDLGEVLTDLSWWEKVPTVCFLHGTEEIIRRCPDLLGEVISVWLRSAQYWAGGNEFNDLTTDGKATMPFRLLIVIDSGA